LKRRIESLGLSNNVIFTGYVDESSKNAMYCAADVFVMPSAGEGFGYVFLEAMACGLPVIGSEKDGSREALRQGTLGELVDPGDNRALRDAILRGLKKERQVPVGLDIFDYGRFAAEVCKAVTSVCSPPEPV